MATYKSQLYLGRARVRATGPGPQDVSASITLPIGKALAAGDILKFFRLAPNHTLENVVLSCDNALFDNAAGTVDVGTDADDDDIIVASTLFQSGGKVIRAEHTGAVDAAGPPIVFTFAGWSATLTRDIMATFDAVGTQTTADDAVRVITLTARVLRTDLASPSLSQPAYLYQDRYNSSGVSSV